MNDHTTQPAAETPFFLDVQGSARFAVYHAGALPVRGAFLFCHPLFEEKLWAHRAYVSFARQLARSGLSVLRMDLRGTGDSDGIFGADEVRDYLDDLEAGWIELMRRSHRSAIRAIFGLRLGGTFALALSQRIREASHMILWDPILDTSRYLQELLRSNLAAQMATYGKVMHTRNQLIEMMQNGQSIDVDGYRLTSKLFDSLSQLNPQDFANELKSSGLILQINRSGDEPLRSEYLDWRTVCPTHEVGVAVEQPFWRELATFYGSAKNLESRSIEWLAQTQ